MASKRFPLGKTYAKVVRLSRWFYLLWALVWLLFLGAALASEEAGVAIPAFFTAVFLLFAALAQYVTRRDAQARADAPTREQRQAPGTA
ncbi:hypothetical protein [Streptomyces bohaiensis]|uniref:Uncharacterized protein n=1 Tax=Streptomyces bohaiensis TaxID=1431344 RepID=A0ABX1C771_9ACTN|nr:hypothetical protein [Streptomyces bohaiensis]NJQ14081.1 hypothetical protein [Streptomyces bohaiensis]